MRRGGALDAFARNRMSVGSGDFRTKQEGGESTLFDSLLRSPSELRRALRSEGYGPRGHLYHAVAIPKPPFVDFGPADSINDVRVRGMKVRNVVKLIEDDGWRQARTRGSHRQYKHPDKPGLVTIAGKPGDDLAPGTLGSILKQAGLTKK